jgi:hypothetical protein
VFTRAADMTEGDRLVADACLGWTRFKVKGEIEAAIMLVEPAALGVPAFPTGKYYYGALLIAKGDVERGVPFLKEALAADLNPIDKAGAVELLKAQGVDVSTLPTGPAETTTSTPETTPPEKTGEGTEPQPETPSGDVTPPGQ